MALFRRDPGLPVPPDPKDELIASLKDQVDYLRHKLDSAEKQIVALSSASVYRLLNPTEADSAPVVPLPPNPFIQRGEVFTPIWGSADKADKEGVS
jgi:hypothetical protein